MQAGGAQRLSALKRRIAAIEGTRTMLEDRKTLSLGVPGIDAALGGGLAFGALFLLRTVPLGARIAILPLLGGAFVFSYLRRSRRPSGSSVGKGTGPRRMWPTSRRRATSSGWSAPASPRTARSAIRRES